MTIELCVSNCDNQNLTIAGGEFSTQCFCGNELIQGAVPAKQNATWLAAETPPCGAGNRLSIYSISPNITVIPIPVPQTEDLPGEWVYQGCLEESTTGRVFPWLIELTTNNSATTCLSQCAAFGYTAGGMQFGSQCFCGDVSDVEKSGLGILDEESCPIPCSGDPFHLCGGAFRIQYHVWNATAHVWNTPEVTGWYEFFIEYQPASSSLSSQR
ncbi:Copper radical oxidase-like protein [Mycena kentingensis (nom. inval.)]|nr:Copper radical oxidase-like protein [Mycena kentingensis (nom. inval.)]